MCPASAITRTYFFLVVFLAVDFLAVDFFAAAFFVAMVVITSFPCRKFTAAEKTSQRFFIFLTNFSLDAPRAKIRPTLRRAPSRALDPRRAPPTLHSR